MVQTSNFSPPPTSPPPRYRSTDDTDYPQTTPASIHNASRQDPVLPSIRPLSIRPNNTRRETPNLAEPVNPPPDAAPPVKIIHRGSFEIEIAMDAESFARCARGDHSDAIQVSHGCFGFLALVFLFPLGLICFCMDKKAKCERCGTIVSKGRCSTVSW